MDVRQKKQKRVEQTDYSNYQQGDCYAYIAIKRDTKLHIAHSVGKRIDIIADHLVWNMSNILSPPTHKYPLEIYTDGNDQYKTSLINYFKKDSVIYGQLIKNKKNGKLVSKVKRKVFRNPKLNDIETVNIESYNGVLRERIARLVRRGKCFSKKRQRFEKHLDIFQFYNNMMKEVEDGNTPMMLEGKTDEKWDWGNIFMHH